MRPTSTGIAATVREDPVQALAAVSASVRLAMVQYRPEKARVGANLAAVREIAEELAGTTDIALFPEAVLSGYFLEGGVEDAALTAAELVDGLGVPSAEAPDLVVGFFELWRHRVHNSAAYLEAAGDRWRVIHIHRKVFLPTYGLFDEARFVEAGRAIEAFDTRFGRMGILICEDMWHSLSAGILAVGGARAILVPSASPVRGLGAESAGRPANLRFWDELAIAAAREHGVYVAVGQLTGSEGGKLFAGGSVVCGPDGAITARGPLWEDGVTPVALDWKTLDRARADSPLLGDFVRALPYLGRSLISAARADTPGGSRKRRGAIVEETEDPEIPAAVADSCERPVRAFPTRENLKRELELDLALVERTLVEFLRDELLRRRGFERAVVGVSGGVDSAVTLALACRALGPENVHALRLPYRTSNPESLSHARLVTSSLGVAERTIDITGSVDAYVREHEPELSPLRRGNVMARFRAVAIFDQSAKLEALPLGTGNKSERLLGYFTWHADDSPPLNPLGDLYKTQVWKLARHLRIPEPVVSKPASADLVVGVDDEDELGVPYHDADPILHGLLTGYREHELEAAGFPASAVAIAARRLRTTHWKRALPAVAVVSSTAIGESFLRPVDY